MSELLDESLEARDMELVTTKHTKVRDTPRWDSGVGTDLDRTAVMRCDSDKDGGEI